mgnify:CR=1 FL=1
MKRVLIIDALNAYLRAYIVDPSISANGQPIGVIKGFIKILSLTIFSNFDDEWCVVCGQEVNLAMLPLSVMKKRCSLIRETKKALCLAGRKNHRGTVAKPSLDWGEDISFSSY